MSSARTRGLGRIGHRVRGRFVKPDDYLGCTFQRAPIVESTLTWLGHVEELVRKETPSPNHVALAATMSSNAEIRHTKVYGYPRPITKRRYHPPKAKKPYYVPYEYGHTPFGLHAIARRGATRVQLITHEHRQKMQEYLAYTTYRRFTEHVQYGGSLIVSWWHGRAGYLVPIDPSGHVAHQLAEGLQWGDFGPAGIEHLRFLEQTSNQPVLALHCYTGGRGIWHAIYNGQPISVTADIDLSTHEGSHGILHRTIGGHEVILALQGTVDYKPWEGTAPSQQEINNFTYSPVDRYDCPLVDNLMRSLERNPRISAPTYATVVNVSGLSHYVYVEPNLDQRPSEGGYDPAFLPYAKSKCVSELALGGYWYNNMKGVAFRAYLRGHYGVKHVWTGDVLGWRMSATEAPIYDVNISGSSGVSTLSVIGGVNSEADLCPYYIDVMSNRNLIVSPGATQTIDKVTRLDIASVQDIWDANGGHRYHFEPGEGEYINIPLPIPIRPVSSSPETAMDNLIRRLQVTQEGAF
jgi:hypothetical protein